MRADVTHGLLDSMLKIMGISPLELEAPEDVLHDPHPSSQGKRLKIRPATLLTVMSQVTKSEAITSHGDGAIVVIQVRNNRGMTR